MGCQFVRPGSIGSSNGLSGTSKLAYLLFWKVVDLVCSTYVHGFFVQTRDISVSVSTQQPSVHIWWSQWSSLTRHHYTYSMHDLAGNRNLELLKEIMRMFSAKVKRTAGAE